MFESLSPLYPLFAAIAVTLVSLTGVFIFQHRGYLTGTHRYILPFAVGVFLGVVFFELIPETLAEAPERGAFAILAGFLGFYLLSHILATFHHHHHRHEDDCAKDGAQMLLVGDAIHNIADGVVIATAFLINPVIGLVTTIGIILHELPQEIVEFGVLIRAGYSRAQAAVRNLLTASSVILGTILTLFLAEHMEGYIWVITGIAAGNLLYIATSDFIPELRENHHTHFYSSFLTTLLGVALIVVMLVISHQFMEQYGVEHTHSDDALHDAHEHEHGEFFHHDEFDEEHFYAH